MQIVPNHVTPPKLAVSLFLQVKLVLNFEKCIVVFVFWVNLSSYLNPSKSQQIEEGGSFQNADHSRMWVEDIIHTCLL